MDAGMFRPQPKTGLATVLPEVTHMQEGEANFVVPAELIGHPARSAMLLALLDGRALPMSMLASEAGVAALPVIAKDLSPEITGLQWVVDGYTLVFASLLLSAGSAGVPDVVHHGLPDQCDHRRLSLRRRGRADCHVHPTIPARRSLTSAGEDLTACRDLAGTGGRSLMRSFPA
jgi:hypothetical protein